MSRKKSKKNKKTQKNKEMKLITASDKRIEMMDKVGFKKASEKKKPFKLLFVYGTLRDGCPLNKTYLKDAIYSSRLTLSGVKLYELEYLPVAVLTNKNKYKIVGDLYYLSEEDIEYIDRLEVNYHKVKLSIAVEGCRQELDIIMYVKKASELVGYYPIRIKSGDWVKYENEYNDELNEMCEKEELEKEQQHKHLDYLLD